MNWRGKNDIHKYISSVVFSARTLKDMSMREVARKAKCDHGYISRVESGKIKPKFCETLMRIFDVLDLEIYIRNKELDGMRNT